MGSPTLPRGQVSSSQHLPVGNHHGSPLRLQVLRRSLCVSSSHQLPRIIPLLTNIVILRLLLGASEGCITNGVMLITSMFYTRLEIGQRVSWTFQCNGFATIVSGFIAFGVAHSSSTAKPHQWQILFLVYCGLTFVIATWFLVCFPDSPVKARFLDEEERTKAVRRVQGNHSGIETKTWKRAQLIEALTDVKTWLFFLFAAVS